MMRKFIAVIPLFALFAACSGGGGGVNVPPRSLQPGPAQNGIGRRPQSITTINYTLGAASYPSGYNPTCGTNLNPFIVLDSGGVTTFWSFGGGIYQRFVVHVGPCHAAVGDSMTATITDDYGHVKWFSAPSPGEPTIGDDGQDSHATVLITDNTTGASVTKDIWFSY